MYCPHVDRATEHEDHREGGVQPTRTRQYRVVRPERMHRDIQTDGEHHDPENERDDRPRWKGAQRPLAVVGDFKCGGKQSEE